MGTAVRDLEVGDMVRCNFWEYGESIGVVTDVRDVALYGMPYLVEWPDGDVRWHARHELELVGSNA